MVIAAADLQREDQTWETQDLRELFDFYPGFMSGAKAPIIVRVPHARLRVRESLVFDALFQTLTALLVSSRLTEQDRQEAWTPKRKLLKPSTEKFVYMQMLPRSLKHIDKAVAVTKSAKFVCNEFECGLNFYKGFKMLTESLTIRQDIPEWLQTNQRVFRAPPETRQVLDKLTRQTVLHALARKKPTVDYEDISCKYYYAFYRKNENIKRHIRKFRQQYWAVNQPDELPVQAQHDSSSSESEAAEPTEQLDHLEVPLDLKNRRSDSHQNDLPSVPLELGLPQKSDLSVVQASSEKFDPGISVTQEVGIMVQRLDL